MERLCKFFFSPSERTDNSQTEQVTRKKKKKKSDFLEFFLFFISWEEQIFHNLWAFSLSLYSVPFKCILFELQKKEEKKNQSSLGNIFKRIFVSSVHKKTSKSPLNVAYTEVRHFSPRFLAGNVRCRREENGEEYPLNILLENGTMYKNKYF